MRSFTSLIGLSCAASLASAAPFSLKDFNGDPAKTSADQINQIQLLAHGSLPVPAPGSAPPKFSPDTLTSQRFIAFNELFEVAFFTSLIANITNDEGDFKIADQGAKTELLADLTAILAQEELHALNANKALEANNVAPIQPCQYVFPTTNVDDAISLASTFTDVVLSTLPDIQTDAAAQASDVGLIRAVGSVIGQEGEQNGFFRGLAKTNPKKNPSALPFLTAGTRLLAFSALNQMFVVPGSCPNIKDIDITPIPIALNVNSPAQAKSESLKYSFVAGEVKDEWKGQNNDWSGLSLVYINQQNAPVIEKLENVQVTAQGSAFVIEFEALFPFNGTTFGNGLTIATIAGSAGPFSSVVDVSKAAIAGPGLIEVN